MTSIPRGDRAFHFLYEGHEQNNVKVELQVVV